jgi:predicted PilT family ATPase
MPIANKPSQQAEGIGYAISSFYLNKHNQDYLAAQKEVEKLKIVNITIENDVVTISTSRPGLLIGRKGGNIDALEKHLDKKIKIVESFHWDEILVPYNYMDDDLTSEFADKMWEIMS